MLFLLITAACSHPAEESPADQDVEITISAAASLKEAMDVIQQSYMKEHPHVKLRVNYGGSGSLQQQISNGAPVDLFFSAAEDKYNRLVEEGKIAEEDGIDLLKNELVLVVPKEGEIAIQQLEDLATDKIQQLTIGTPESVPAGKYARESLETIGLWGEIEAKIVYAKDVRQVLSYVETGNVEAGLVYKTDAMISDKVKIVATASSNTHSPIVYPVGVIKDSKHYEAAKQFYRYLQSEAALKVFEDYGFIME
ncbi:molybdate ABC transporter substrate-binding protein [Lederbergia galactosidilytica]|uniref:Molybdenum ABC transporter substrate-binding protein n=1 Tax=Lederbergia galactosidilytica TaxID=217031 RepID=A0A177ZMJ0_9BACI|nr:molybdate ABC transporter substrate-binding protein [Lederbergia galactosidilytica]KRG15496.1 molybdenum ABC transporter substrate-binding protein [Virgibacillus soli]OAK68570.1 molybdenum ABC transporter substrate-binding protein [Lederbergia galactosidilytica]